MPKVPLSSPKPPNRVFALATPRHMYMKLYWELKEFEDHLDSQEGVDIQGHLIAAYKAFNTAVTAWHLVDWVWGSVPKESRSEAFRTLQIDGKNQEDFNNGLIAKSKCLKICKEVANGSKHMSDKKSLSMKADLKWKSVPAQAGTLYAGGPLSRHYFDLVIEDENQIISALEVFRGTQKFWRRTLADLGFLEDELIMGTSDE